jgi:plasmid replication initiation protein
MTDGKDPKRQPTEVRIRDNNVVMLENAIARGSFKLSPSALKIFYIMAAAAQITSEEYTYVSVDIETIVPLIDPSRTGFTYENLFNWGRELRRSEIILEGEDEKSAFGWIDFVRQTKTTLDVYIGPAMKPHVAKLQKNFQRGQLSKMATFHGRHALRLYGILMSYSGQAKDGKWAVNLSIEDIRWKLQVMTEYPTNGEFARRCVYDPVKEINTRDVGIRVEVERELRRRHIVGFLFRVQVTEERREKVVNPKPATPTEVALDKLVKKHPAKWDECLTQATIEVDAQHELFTGEFAVPREDRIKAEAERLFRERTKPKGAPK